MNASQTFIAAAAALALLVKAGPLATLYLHGPGGPG